MRELLDLSGLTEQRTDYKKWFWGLGLLQWSLKSSIVSLYRKLDPNNYTKMKIDDFCSVNKNSCLLVALFTHFDTYLELFKKEVNDLQA